MMKRREFMTLVGATAATWPLSVLAQQPKLPVIGYLGSATAEAWAERLNAFRDGLGESGLSRAAMSRSSIAGRTVTMIVCRALPPIWCIAMWQLSWRPAARSARSRPRQRPRRYRSCSKPAPIRSRSAWSQA
jgi:hypothetical protein